MYSRCLQENSDFWYLLAVRLSCIDAANCLAGLLTCRLQLSDLSKQLCLCSNYIHIYYSILLSISCARAHACMHAVLLRAFD